VPSLPSLVVVGLLNGGRVPQRPQLLQARREELLLDRVERFLRPATFELQMTL
jgi:hypothetical protein